VFGLAASDPTGVPDDRRARQGTSAAIRHGRPMPSWVTPPTSVTYPSFRAWSTSLEELSLDALSHVTELPPLHKLTRLRRITLNTMTGLNDLSVLMTAPALEELDQSRMSHLHPAQVTQLAAHPALRKASIGPGSDQKPQVICAPIAAQLLNALPGDARAITGDLCVGGSTRPQRSHSDGPPVLQPTPRVWPVRHMDGGADR